MNTVLEMIKTKPQIEIDYPEQRETDMGETSLHYQITTELFNMLKIFLSERDDVFIAANMNLYYEEGDANKWYAPDLMLAFGVSGEDRSSYKVWDEGVFPQVIFEVASNRTWKVDSTDKLELYGELGAEEYYILDTKNYLPLSIMSYQRTVEDLIFSPSSDNRIFSPQLNLEIVKENKKYRLFDTAHNEFLLTPAEMKAEIERLKRQH